MQESESIGINVADIYCYFVNKPGVKLISGFLVSPGNYYQQLRYNNNTCSEKRYACGWLSMQECVCIWSISISSSPVTLYL